MNNSKAATASAFMGKIAKIVGYALGVPSLLIIFLCLADWESEGAKELTTLALLVLIPCVFIVYKGIQIKKRINLFIKYDSIITANITPLENIAAKTAMPVNFVRADLQKMIDKRYFVNAYIDMTTSNIVINGRSSAASSQVQ